MPFCHPLLTTPYLRRAIYEAAYKALFRILNVSLTRVSSLRSRIFCGQTRMQSALLFLIVFLAMICPCVGEIIGPTPTLAELTSKGVLIFKGAAISNQTVEDSALKAVPGFIVVETKFQLISKIKGQIDGTTVHFRHYEHDAHAQGLEMWSPEAFSFQEGRSYLIVTGPMNGTDGAIQFQAHTSLKGDDGVLLCGDAQPVSGSGLKSLYWTELTKLLQNHDVKDAVYAMDQLKLLSMPAVRRENRNFRLMGGLSEFDRRDVMDVVHGFLSNPDDGVAQAAIDIIAGDNPYTQNGDVLGWLSAVGGNKSFQAQPANQNDFGSGGERYEKELLAVAENESNAPQTRAMAIEALGPGRHFHAWADLFRWVEDPSPAVRRAAALATSGEGEDYYDEDHGIYSRLAVDPAPEVRRALALAIGFGQSAHAFRFLPPLLTDPADTVRQAAAASICSFPIKNATAAAFFQSNLDNPEFGPLFLIALAGDNPADHLGQLARTILADKPVKSWNPLYDSSYFCRTILFDYLRTVPRDQFSSGKYDGLLDALAYKASWSDQYVIDLFCFFINRGYKDRAQKLHQTTTGYLTGVLDRAEKSPDSYQRAE